NPPARSRISSTQTLPPCSRRGGGEADGVVGGMSQDTDQQILQTLREIRDGQREIVAALGAQRELVAEQAKSSRARVGESIGRQRDGLRRQRSVMVFAFVGIVACIAAIGYLVLRYF